jgi:hypothetical protein
MTRQPPRPDMTTRRPSDGTSSLKVRHRVRKAVVPSFPLLPDSKYISPLVVAKSKLPLSAVASS